MTSAVPVLVIRSAETRNNLGILFSIGLRFRSVLSLYKRVDFFLRVRKRSEGFRGVTHGNGNEKTYVINVLTIYFCEIFLVFEEETK